MSQLDRLIRAARPHLGDDEALLGTLLGRLADRRSPAAIVATDTRVIVVIGHLRGVEVVAFRYADITELLPDTAVDGTVVSIVSPTGRVRIDRIVSDSTTRIVLDLLTHRSQIAEADTVRVATSGTPGLRHGVRVRA